MANLLGNFGPALTYEVFIHLGLVTAIPVSAGESSYLLHLFLYSILLSNSEMSGGLENKVCLNKILSLSRHTVLDVNLNGVVFEGMKLAGTIMIVNGFLLVLLPENWPDYLTRLLR